MKPVSSILATALVLLAVLWVFLDQENPGLAAARPPADVSLARKLRAPSRTSPPPAILAEQVSRTSAAASPDEESGTASDEEESVVPDEIRKATALRKALSRESERFDEATGNHVVLQPAAWIDLGDDSTLSQEHQDGIQQIASELRDKIADSGLDPSSPEYRKLWNHAVRESDWKFRARYGARAWARHHIQAYHSTHSRTQAN